MMLRMAQAELEHDLPALAESPGPAESA
jgi:hypothetical protein